MNQTTFIIILIGLAFILATVTFPLALKLAKRWNIVDNPEARKLQKKPVPVFGGIVVVIGMLIPLIVAAQYYHFYDLWYAIGAIILLWIVGVTDDIRRLSAAIRFILELLIVWVLIWHPNQPGSGLMINNLYGLWGRYSISFFSAIPLTLVAGVGIINAINLIDGVDGYSSGYGIVANTLFSYIFFSQGCLTLGIFSAVAAAALLPFYLHNVFGDKSKMFIGDGGSLVIGMVMTYDVFALLSNQSPCRAMEQQGVSLVALALVILLIPVFDTLRVMTSRILRGESPFMPDKTHLHHLYIDMHFSHAATSLSIILWNLLAVVAWYVGYRHGLTITQQFYLVISFGLSIILFYEGMRYCQRQNNTIWQLSCKLGDATRVEQKGFWIAMQHLVDWEL